MEFAYVTFVTPNEPYVSLMRETIRSVLTFSKYPLIIYCINFDKPPFEASEQVIQRLVKSSDYPDVKHVFHWKPWIILNSILNGLRRGQYIESDDLITPYADRLKDLVHPVYPLSPIHPDQTTTTPTRHMKRLDVRNKTQSYVHAHVLFCDTNRPFLLEWYNNCRKTLDLQWAYDEAVLNCTLWKHGVTNHYLPLFDPTFTDFKDNPQTRETAFMFHGCKDPVVHKALLDDMITHYLRERR